MDNWNTKPSGKAKPNHLKEEYNHQTAQLVTWELQRDF